MEFKLAIESGNEAFTEDPEAEVARILREVADKLQHENGGNIRDINGNTVGLYELLVEDSEEDAS